MNGSSSSTTRIIVGSDIQRNSIRTGQWYNIGSRFRGTRTMPYTPVSCETGHHFRSTRTMPYTPVSCGTGHSFCGTCTMPYAYWGRECQSERTPALGENAYWCCVLGSSRERYSRHCEVEWESIVNVLSVTSWRRIQSCHSRRLD